MCHIHTADVGLYLEIKGELYEEIIQMNLGHENHVSINTCCVLYNSKGDG